MPANLSEKPHPRKLDNPSSEFRAGILTRIGGRGTVTEDELIDYAAVQVMDMLAKMGLDTDQMHRERAGPRILHFDYHTWYGQTS